MPSLSGTVVFCDPNFSYRIIAYIGICFVSAVQKKLYERKKGTKVKKKIGESCEPSRKHFFQITSPALNRFVERERHKSIIKPNDLSRKETKPNVLGRPQFSQKKYFLFTLVPLLLFL